MLLADVFCHVVNHGHCNMADDVAIVADGIAKFFYVVIVADGKAT